MTPAGLSQPGLHAARAGLTIRAMAYAVLVRFDPAGARPLIVGDDSEPLTAEDGVRYRLVTVAGDREEAARIADVLRRRIDSGELSS